MDLLMVREHRARTLLIHCRWDVDNLLTVFVEKGKAHLFAEAGVTMVEHDASRALPPSSTLTCDICIEDVPSSETTRMDCGHVFCNNCWTEHFIVKINEGQSRRIRCMTHKCNDICDEGIVRNLVSKRHPSLAEKFDRFLLKSYIDDNKMVKWCPSVPNCSNAVRVGEGDTLCEVECTCGFQFCFNCSSEAHSPCSCLMWELWRKKCTDESASADWIAVNTKNCPTCLKPVEKYGGCNAVKCICGKPFCWRCGQKLPHNCTQYRPPAEAEHEKQYLYRYTHYHKHYIGHKQSIKLEAKQEKRFRKEVSISEEYEPRLRDFSWVKQGFDRLLRARRILSYSYVFAFYMFGDELFNSEIPGEERLIKQHLFEDQQEQLEAKVEKLSDMMEEPFQRYYANELQKSRLDVLVLTDIIDKLCKKLYDYIENDLLGSLQSNAHNIAPYKSKGVVRASEVAHQKTEVDTDKYSYVPPPPVMTGCLKVTDQPSSSGGSSKSKEPSEKRA